MAQLHFGIIAHIYFLIGTRSRLFVALSWLWVFLSGQNSARLITQKETLKETADEMRRDL